MICGATIRQAYRSVPPSSLCSSLPTRLSDGGKASKRGRNFELKKYFSSKIANVYDPVERSITTMACFKRLPGSGLFPLQAMLSPLLHVCELLPTHLSATSNVWFLVYQDHKAFVELEAGSTGFAPRLAPIRHLRRSSPYTRTNRV